MSMTRKEALNKLLEMLTIYPFQVDEAQAIGKTLEVLRTPTREQVEKVWRGQWIDCSNGWMCSRCENDNTYAKPFCPSCGAAMTDEAVDMMLERLEAPNEDNGCSESFVQTSYETYTHKYRTVDIEIPDDGNEWHVAGEMEESESDC